MFKRVLTCFFCLGSLFAVAQDTIVQGVIHVRRPLEPAKFHVKVSNTYGDFSNNSHISRFSSSVIIMSDSTPGTLSAQPYARGISDSLSISRDDGALIKALCENYPGTSFDWNAFFSTLDYGFEWDDSVRSDSAQFFFEISSKGVVTAKAMPWKNADSGTRAFEKLVGAKMATCGYWFPARVMTGKRDKTRNVNSSVLVTVYAEDAMAGRLKPLKVIIDQ